MVYLNAEFKWDEKKDLANQKKHNVYFIEAIDTFFDPKGIQLVDTSHSSNEKRYYWVGLSKSGKVLTTYFTRRGERIRIIGCAEWRKFRRPYYETTENE